MRSLEAKSVSLLGNTFAYVVKRPAQFRTLAQPLVDQNFLQQDIVLPFPVRIEQSKQMCAEPLGVIRIAYRQAVGNILK